MSILFGKFEDDIEARSAVLAGVFAGVFFTLKYSLTLASIITNYVNASSSYDRDFDLLVLPHIPNLVLLVLLLILTLFIWRKNSFIATVFLLLIYGYEQFYIYVIHKQTINLWSMVSLAMIILIITGLRGTWAMQKFKNDPDAETID